MKNTLLVRHFVSLLIVGFCCLSSVPVLTQNGPLTDYVKLISGGVNLGAWNNEISELPQAPAPTTYESPITLVLAAQRTNRPDLLRHFKHYHGGNAEDTITLTCFSLHLSVGFTGAVGFIFAALWFVSFGLVLLAYHCCRWRRCSLITQTYRTSMSTIKKVKPRHRANYLVLIYAHSHDCIGCILLSVGQDEFHGEVLHTLKYVVNQSDYTVQILNNLFFPSNVITDTDKLNIDLNAVADTLTEKTDENAVKIRRVFNVVQLALISVVAVMLILALLGLLLSVLGHQHVIHIFIVSGWLLVAITFILCGVFVILN
ncbi:hypothetical protein E1A91_D11G208500v1, partial [Gossypium mustelinum]